MVGTKEELEEGRKKRRREKVFEIVERLEKGTPFPEKLLYVNHTQTEKRTSSSHRRRRRERFLYLRARRRQR